ncbi:hypothetical protein [Streptomyces meridianus]|uniref:Uncharacterized protein n=1 Tax=Streptomyces meridianus TaxID=2938945 RepID=A0ABT0X0T0_9ACTN|nr:hypothetical protein [Streptomyces meridianus]MCM2576174.1 hypothetical protein [Streptomyces meridianus]
MPVDPTDPATFADDVPQEVGVDLEAPEADAAEQMTDLLPQEDQPLSDRDLEDANPADAIEQARVVGEDEDDYR